MRGMAGVILALGAEGAHGVRGDHALALTAEGGTEHPGAFHDAPPVRRRRAEIEIVAADPDTPIPDGEHDLAVLRFLEDRIPRAPAQDVGDAIGAAGPAQRRHGCPPAHKIRRFAKFRYAPTRPDHPPPGPALHA